MEILIISGLSGGGKSKAASFLEDIGFYIVDNLPAEMMMKFAEFCAASSGRYDRVALVYDVRSGEPTDMLVRRPGAAEGQRRPLPHAVSGGGHPRPSSSRYKETRRTPSPGGGSATPLEEAVQPERR